MSELRIKLMYNHAANLMFDAEALRLRNSESPAPYLLDLLALEIFLKTCVAIESGKLERGHEYAELFSKLELATRSSLAETAAVREGPVADFTNIELLLKLWGRNFIRLRYPYEAYEGLSEREYLRLGPQWIERGAKDEEATFDFRPKELHGILFALSNFVQEWLASSALSREK